MCGGKISNPFVSACVLAKQVLSCRFPAKMYVRFIGTVDVSTVLLRLQSTVWWLDAGRILPTNVDTKIILFSYQKYSIEALYPPCVQTVCYQIGRASCRERELLSVVVGV